MAEKPENVIFAGFMPPVILRDAYCGADAFAFFSYEETEGIVVLEALSCEIPVIVRDIPVYEKWLEDGVQVRKATDPFLMNRRSERFCPGNKRKRYGAEPKLAEFWRRNTA